jgi:hypothetical protein
MAELHYLTTPNLFLDASQGQNAANAGPDIGELGHKMETQRNLSIFSGIKFVWPLELLLSAQTFECEQSCRRQKGHASQNVARL